jgi:hypothetical protein
MTHAALHPAISTCQGNRDLLVVTIRLPRPELTLLYGLAYTAYPLGTRISSMAAAGEADAATVRLHRATCPLSVALRDATVRGGL